MFHPVSLDVSEEVAVDKVVSEYCEKYGCIDILVNNAGIAIGSPLIDFTLDIWQKNFKVNAEGTFLCTRAVVRYMVKKMFLDVSLTLHQLPVKMDLQIPPRIVPQKRLSLVLPEPSLWN